MWIQSDQGETNTQEHDPARLSFRFDGEIKSFTDKQKLKEFGITKPALQETLKGLFFFFFFSKKEKATKQSAKVMKENLLEK